MSECTDVDRPQPLGGGRGGRGGRGDLPDLSKIGAKLKDRSSGLLKDLKDKNVKLPKLQSNKKLPLEYNLSTFVEIYAGDRHGTEPTAHPKHDRTHADFDPFEIPMPTLKAEWSPEDAFAKVSASDLLHIFACTQPLAASLVKTHSCHLASLCPDDRCMRRWTRTVMAS